MQGAHGIAVVSPNTKYIVVNGEFELPTDGLVTNPAPYTSVVSFVDPDSMQVKFQVRVNGNIDIADTSKDGRYSFSTVYNLEQGKDMGSMIQYDRDAVAAIDIPAAEKAVAAGRGEVRNGVPILDPETNPGVLTLIPVPKNPHGINVTPDGRYAIASRQAVADGHDHRRAHAQDRRRAGGRPWPAAHDVRRSRQRLHLAVPRQPGREVEHRQGGRGLVGLHRRPHQRALQHRPPAGGGRRLTCIRPATI